MISRREQVSHCHSTFFLFTSDCGTDEFSRNLEVLFSRAFSHPNMCLDSTVEVCRRCLKSNRGNSHPERQIGKLLTAEFTPCRNSLQSRGAKLTCLMQTLENYKDNFLTEAISSSHSSYFILSLYLDILKECRSREDIPSELSFLLSCHEWMSVHMSGLIKYVPNLLKIIDIIKTFSKHSEKVLTLNQCIDLVRKFVKFALSEYEKAFIFEQHQELQTLNGCSLTSDDSMLHSVGPAICVLLVEVVTKVLRLAGREQQESENREAKQSSSMCDILRNAEELSSLLLQVVSVQHTSISDFMRAMSVSDKELMAFLLGVEDVSRQCITLHQRPGLATAALLRIERVFSNDSGLSTCCLFVHFVCEAVCCDSSTCVDMITQTETEALKYFVLVMRALCSFSDPEQSMKEACAACWTDRAKSKGVKKKLIKAGTDVFSTQTEVCPGQHCIVWVQSEESFSDPLSDCAEEKEKEDDDGVSSGDVSRSHAFEGGKEKRGRAEGGEEGGRGRGSLAERVHSMEWSCRGERERVDSSREVSPGGRGASDDEADREGSVGGDEVASDDADLFEVVMEFLSALRDELWAVQEQGLVPFDCSPLIRRMSAAIECCAGDREEIGDL